MVQILNGKNLKTGEKHRQLSLIYIDKSTSEKKWFTFLNEKSIDLKM